MCVQWTTEFVGVLGWACRFIHSESFAEFKKTWFLFEWQVESSGIPQVSPILGFGARTLGTELSEANVGLEPWGMAGPICWHCGKITLGLS